MAMPRSVVKIKKHGVEFTSSVDRVSYTLNELTRAALKDTARLLRRRMIDKLKKIKGLRRAKRPYSSTQYWVRRRETDLQVGFKHDTYYGVDQELGTNGQPKRSILRDTTFENIDQIRIIQGQYLSAIEDENRARGLIDEAEEVGDADQAP